jgi:hypothetical protein
MPDAERDSTQDWLLPAEARPATMLELEQRVDVALAVARSAEAAALEIGVAAFDAADQARRAAEFAERAVAGNAVAEADGAENSAIENRADRPAGQNGGEHPDERLRLFSERADRVMIRLRALEPVA